MAILISQGNVNDLIAASKEGTAINLFKKNFNDQVIKSIKLVDSMIAQCTFIKTSIYGSSFVNCTFVNCDFSESDLYGITFENCKFNECNFTKAKLETVSFAENTVLNNCNFNGADLSKPETISGLNDKDLNIIHENGEETPAFISELGFEPDEDKTYKLNNDDLTFVYLWYDVDTEIYRLSLFVDNDSFLTIDLSASLDEIDKESLKRTILDLLNSSIRKLNRYFTSNEIEDPKEKINSINNLIKTIEEK